MRRSVLGIDRVAAIVLGLLLLVAGVAVAGWYGGRLRPYLPERLSTESTGDLLGAAWWPWAAGTTGTITVLLGLWWLVAHLPRRGVGVLVLPGSNGSGRLLIDPATTVGVAAEVLADTPGVRSAHGRVIRDRGEIVVSLTGTIDPRADLAEIIVATDAVATALRTVLGRDDAHARIRLSVARRAQAPIRVR